MKHLTCSLVALATVLSPAAHAEGTKQPVKVERVATPEDVGTFMGWLILILLPFATVGHVERRLAERRSWENIKRIERHLREAKE